MSRFRQLSFLSAAATVACGWAAVSGHAAWALAAIAAAGLASLGALLPPNATRAVLLLALILTPELPTGRTFGFDVHWSAGLTLPNFLIPALAVPLLAGAWIAGKPLLPRSWPRLALWLFALLAWGLLTLLPHWLAGQLGSFAGLTVLAHAAKLAGFVALGVLLAPTDDVWPLLAGRLLLAAMACESLIGLAQVASWLPVFSPLAHGATPRATGTFYDANMYAVLIAWALLWVLCQPLHPSGARRLGGLALASALAANLALASSRAGYLAFAVGVVFLALRGYTRPVVRAVALLLLLGVLFPARTWQRGRSAALAIAAAFQPRTVAPARPADASTRARLASMRQALRQVEAHPLFGLGFGRALYLGVPPISRGPVRPARAGRFRGAQDMPLTVLAEMGPIGLVLFLAAFLAPLRRLRQAQAGGRLPLLAGYAGLLAASLTLEALWNARLLALVVMLTAGVAAGVRPQPAATATEAA
jgi:O-antigen ligase